MTPAPVNGACRGVVFALLMMGLMTACCVLSANAFWYWLGNGGF